MPNIPTVQSIDWSAEPQWWGGGHVVAVHLDPLVLVIDPHDNRRTSVTNGSEHILPAVAAALSLRAPEGLTWFEAYEERIEPRRLTARRLSRVAYPGGQWLDAAAWQAALRPLFKAFLRYRRDNPVRRRA